MLQDLQWDGWRKEIDVMGRIMEGIKILVVVPLGAIACSTMAGNRMVSHTMMTYCKYFLSCVFEAVTMALAIVVCNAFINAGLSC